MRNESVIKIISIIFSTLLFCWLTGCPSPASDPAFHSNKSNESGTPSTTKVAHCQVRYARGFNIAYHEGYKVITVFDPEDLRGSKTMNTFVLVPRGKRPSMLPEGTVIEIPVRRMALRSATHIPFFKMLNKLDHIVAITQGKYVFDPEVRSLIREGRIAEVGIGSGMTAQFNMERLYPLHPDLVVSWWTKSPAYAAHLKVQEVGIPVALMADYYETTPLGRTEWIKFVAAFLDAEAEGERIFEDVERRYTAMRKTAEGVHDRHRPTVMCGSSYQGTWYIAGGKSYLANLIREAGGQYLFDDDPSTGSKPVNSETAIIRGKNADFWITHNQNHHSLASLVAEDRRYRLFKAFQTRQIYNNMGRVGPDGANDYYQGTVARPDLLLADMIAILHPELLPNHKLIWHVRLPERIP